MSFVNCDVWSGMHGRLVLPGKRRRPVFWWVRWSLGKWFGGLGSKTRNEVFHHWESPQRACSYQRIEILPNQIRYGISFSFSWSILNAICNCRSGSALFKKPPPGGYVDSSCWLAAIFTTSYSPMKLMMREVVAVYAYNDYGTRVFPFLTESLRKIGGCSDLERSIRLRYEFAKIRQIDLLS